MKIATILNVIVLMESCKIMPCIIPETRNEKQVTDN